LSNIYLSNRYIQFNNVNPKELKNLIAGGEGYQAEWKERIPSKIREITEELCAFANAAGGTFLIGVDDKNSIVGGNFPNHKRSSLQNSIGEINPPIQIPMEVVSVDGKDVMVLEVPSGKQKPYVYSGAIFVRQGPNNQKLTTAEEMRDFFQQSERIYFDESPCPGFDFQNDIEVGFLNIFRSQAGLSSSVSSKQVFQNYRLFTEDNHFKAGAVLFFGSSPDQFYDKAIIRCIHFDGNDKRLIKDQKDLRGPLFHQYQKSLEWLKGKLNIRFDIEGEGSRPRNEIWEIPETVFKESITNALSHRDYYDRGGRITLELFDDRVEITNPGGLISGVIPSEFGTRSLSRNPLIFGLFERMKMVEQVGSGITRIRDLMEAADLPAPNFDFGGLFITVLKRPVIWHKKRLSLENDLSKNQLKILDLMEEDKQITIKKLAEEIDISTTSIDNNIKKLKENGLVIRKGGDKEGRWIIV
jgi:ATP-dependent DNA helicase RecG